MRINKPPAALITLAVLVLVIPLARNHGMAASGAHEAAAPRTPDRGPELADLAAPPEGWRPIGAPVTVAGAALFDVINGGAEMYLQTGFRKAVFSAFQNPDGLSVNLEIYQMTDTAAARTIFAQKSGHSGRAAAYGQEARLDSYYLNFRYGPYQVTISGYAATPETLAAIKELAAAVDKRLRRD